jgi:hypothetical protein
MSDEFPSAPISYELIISLTIYFGQFKKSKNKSGGVAGVRERPDDI